MADLHIEDFYRDVARILLSLYRSFPNKVILYVEDIAGPDEPDEFGLHSPRFEACFSTMVWLAEQGYLSFEETIASEALDQTVLTRHGFLLLNSRWSAADAEAVDDESEGVEPPSVAAQLQSNVEKLRGALKSASSIQIKQCVSTLLSQKIWD